MRSGIIQTLPNDNNNASIKRLMGNIKYKFVLLTN